MGGLVDRCSVTLGIYGQDVDPDSITEILKCQPTTSHRKGDRTSPRVPSPRRQGAWLLCVEGEAPVEPEELITQLLDRIHPAVPEWHQLVRRYDVRLFLGIFLDEFNRGFRLSEHVLARVAAMQLKVDFDIYAGGD